MNLLRAIEVRRKESGNSVKTIALEAVFVMVKETLSYNLDEVNKIVADDSLHPSGLINLGVYIDRKIGTCRHQALLCAYLLEKLINRGDLAGSVSVERSINESKGGHVWCRYTSKNGTVFILDAAHLDEVIRLQDHARGDFYWDYTHPEER